jgi:hypothetical protein
VKEAAQGIYGDDTRRGAVISFSHGYHHHLRISQYMADTLRIRNRITLPA